VGRLLEEHQSYFEKRQGALLKRTGSSGEQEKKPHGRGQREINLVTLVGRRARLQASRFAVDIIKEKTAVEHRRGSDLGSRSKDQTSDAFGAKWACFCGGRLSLNADLLICNSGFFGFGDPLGKSYWGRSGSLGALGRWVSQR